MVGHYTLNIVMGVQIALDSPINFNGVVAQVVEQRTENPRVECASHSHSTKYALVFL